MDRYGPRQRVGTLTPEQTGAASVVVTSAWHSTGESMEGSMDHLHHHVKPRVVLLVALGTSLALVLTSLTARLLWISGNLDGYDATANAILNVDAEGNVATWFASSLLLSCAAVALLVSFLVPAPVKRVWQAFAALALFVSADEASSIHEKLISPLRSLLNTGGVLYYAWVIAAIPAVIVSAILLRTIFEPLQPSESRIVKIALAVLVTGAIGGEMAGGPFADEPDSTTYVLITHAEEALEFGAASILVYGLLTIALRMLEDRAETHR
jgi:hypothetical protein